MADTKWEVGDTYKNDNPAGVTEITDGSGYVVAFVPRHMGSSRAASRDSIPPMIAAAPDMYEALKGMLNLWKSGRMSGPETEQAEDALAKAVPHV